MRLLRDFATLVLLLVMSTAALEAASVYRWTDADGRVHFSDEPPPKGNRGENVSLPRSAPADRTPSPRVQRIRCRDFRTALVALQEIEDVPRDDPRLVKARHKARSGIDQWCG